ncbi:hypothetical protein D3C73_1284570 [compost metagenome]
MTKTPRSKARAAFRSMRDIARVSSNAPTTTARAYPDINQPAVASLTAKSDATSGRSPMMTNSVSPMPKPPKAKAISPMGIRIS